MRVIDLIRKIYFKGKYLDIISAVNSDLDVKFDILLNDGLITEKQFVVNNYIDCISELNLIGEYDKRTYLSSWYKINHNKTILISFFTDKVFVTKRVIVETKSDWNILLLPKDEIYDDECYLLLKHGKNLFENIEI